MKNSTALAALLLLGACGSVRAAYDEFARPNLPDTQAEGGRVYISACPPIAWNDIAADLNPNFELKSADSLLAKVLPVTLTDEMNFRRGVDVTG